MIEAKIDVSELDELVEKITTAPDIFINARRKAFERAAPKLKQAVDSKIGGSGKVRSWQKAYLGTKGGYAKVQPLRWFEDNATVTTKSGSEYSVGAVTNAINSGHKIPSPTGKNNRYQPRIKVGLKVPGKKFYEQAQADVAYIAENTANEVLNALIGYTMSIVCYDRGIYLCNNDGTYKFRDVTAEEMVRAVCDARGIPVAELAATGVKLSRKFTATALDKIVTTAYSLAAEQTGERYAVRMTPSGLLVKLKSQSQSSLILRPKSNLIRASTVQSIEKMTNSVGIYDEQGNQLQVLSNQEAIDLYGTMQRHITQKDGEDATSEAQALLDDGGVSETVTVEVLGDSTLITGETVIAQEENTGLSGLFWIDADFHTWQRGQYTARLTLNCRNVMNQTTAGSELS